MADFKKTYWLALFSNHILKKWEIDEEKDETIFVAIANYLHSQNKGEAKSDRIYFCAKTQVTKEEFDSVGDKYYKETYLI